MCKAAVAHKLDFLKQLGVVLQGTVKLSMLLHIRLVTAVVYDPA